MPRHLEGSFIHSTDTLSLLLEPNTVPGTEYKYKRGRILVLMELYSVGW